MVQSWGLRWWAYHGCMLMRSPCAYRQEANAKAEAIKQVKAELTSTKERAEQIQMEKERKVRTGPSDSLSLLHVEMWPRRA